MALDKPYTGGKFALELDSREAVGFVSAIDGGHFKADPVVSMVGVDNYVTRYAGKPKYDDVTISVGMAMSPTFWKWVQASLDYKPERRNGALVSYDFNFKERSRRSFYRAVISEIGFPALDASSKNTALINVKFSPERLEWKQGDGSQLGAGQGQNQVSKQKLWLSSNFRFELDKMRGDPKLRNVKVEAFTVKQNVIANPVGYELDARKEMGRLELPQIVVTFPESAAEPWMKWWDSAVADGDRSDQYTTGVISYLAADLNRELARVELDGVSLVSLEIDKYEAAKEQIATVKATLNVEKLAFVTGDGTV